LFAPEPSSSDLAARHAERDQPLAEQGRRLDWAALEQMRTAVAEPIDCALETLRPLTAKLAAAPMPPDPDVWVELRRILDSATCTRTHAAMCATSVPSGTTGDKPGAVYQDGAVYKEAHHGDRRAQDAQGHGPLDRASVT
jgi:hypothetical protein